MAKFLISSSLRYSIILSKDSYFRMSMEDVFLAFSKSISETNMIGFSLMIKNAKLVDKYPER